MNSSTSSSKNIYLKILLVILVGSGLAMANVRLFTYLNDASSETILGRVMQAKQALPQIVQEPKDVVLFYGSSMTGAGFSPRQFDRDLKEQGIEIKSFNFGFGGLNPYFQDILARRIKEQFLHNDKRIKLALLEFNPFQATKTRHRRAKSLEDSFITLLASDNEILDILRDDPERGTRLYNIKYLRDSISAEMVTNFFAGGFRTPRARTLLARDEELNKQFEEVGDQLTEAFEKEYPNYVSSRWSYDWQGGGTIPEERSAETLEIFEKYYLLQNKNTRNYDDDRLSRIASADIIDLDFSDGLVDAYIRLIKEFQQISDKVEVIMLPRNTKWITNSEIGLKRLNETLTKIESATGIKIVNHQDLSVMKPQMFRDTTHLNRYQGAVTYTQFLIEEYANVLRN